MNDFVEEEWSNMKDFLQKISVSRFYCTSVPCIWRLFLDCVYVCLSILYENSVSSVTWKPLKIYEYDI